MDRQPRLPEVLPKKSEIAWKLKREERFAFNSTNKTEDEDKYDVSLLFAEYFLLGYWLIKNIKRKCTLAIQTIFNHPIKILTLKTMIPSTLMS